MNKNYIIFVLVGIIAVGGLILFGQKQENESINKNIANMASSSESGTPIPPATTKTNTSPNTISLPPSGSKNIGRVVFAIADEAVGLDSLQSIILTVNELAVRNAGGSWISVSKTPRAINLLDLYKKSQTEIFSDVNLIAGTYNQVRLSIGNVVVVQKAGLKSVGAKLTAETLIFDTKLVVEKSKNSAMVIDVNSAKSLHGSTDGSLLFFPVIRLSTEHGIGTIQVLGGVVDLLNGQTDYDQTWGVDQNGKLLKDFSLAAATKIEFLGKVIRIIPLEENSADIRVGAQTVIDTAISGGYVSEVISITTVVKENKRVWQIVGKKGNSFVDVYADTITGKILAVE